MFASRTLGATLRGHYDVIVIGGGISGVQIARHAAGRGLRAVLFEARDYCAGTSSATSKMIHGGLRYLEHRDFAVVQEAVKERRYLGIAAPHLVAPRSFMLTAYDWSEPKAPVLGAGVALYEAMAWQRNQGQSRENLAPRFRWVPKGRLLRAVPWLDPEGLRGAWRHDDTLNLHAERLLLAMVKTFVDEGGTAVNHAEVTRILRDESVGRVTGVEVTDQVTGGTIRCHAPVVVNAAGPWVAEALGDLAAVAGTRVRHSKGVHLLTTDLGGRDGVFVRGKNGRHIIVNPWNGRTLIGPTDTPIDGGPDSARVEELDLELLLETFDSVAARPLDREKVISALVGVRPLVDDGTDTYSSSRRFDITDHAGVGLDGLVSVSGGKWTTARLMGYRVVEHVVRHQGVFLPPLRAFDSRTLPLRSSFGAYESVADSFTAALRSHPEVGLSEQARLHLARLYGTEHTRVLDLVEEHPALREPVGPDIAAQVAFAVMQEAAVTLEDVLDRRLVVGTLGPVPERAVRRAAEVMAEVAGWSGPRRDAEVDGYLARQRRTQDLLGAYRTAAR